MSHDDANAQRYRSQVRCSNGEEKKPKKRQDAEKAEPAAEVKLRDGGYGVRKLDHPPAIIIKTIVPKVIFLTNLIKTTDE